MAKVVSYVFDSLFERKESISYKEKKVVVLIFFSLSILATIMLVSV
jgi:hypothetical protein